MFRRFRDSGAGGDQMREIACLRNLVAVLRFVHGGFLRVDNGFCRIYHSQMMGYFTRTKSIDNDIFIISVYDCSIVPDFERVMLR